MRNRSLSVGWRAFEPEDFTPAFSEEGIQQEKNFRAQLVNKLAKK